MQTQRNVVSAKTNSKLTSRIIVRNTQCITEICPCSAQVGALSTADAIHIGTVRNVYLPPPSRRRVKGIIDLPSTSLCEHA